MSTKTRLALPLLLSLALPLVSACDTGDDGSLRDALIEEVEAAEITLAEAVETAQAAAPGATVLEAELDFDDGDEVTYDIELLDGDSMREIDVSPADGSVIRDRSEALDADDLAEAQAAAELVAASDGWTALIGSAESEVGGVAFEAEAEGDDGVLEVELLVDGVIWEVELASDGTVLKSEPSDDQLDGDDADDDDDDDDDEGETDDDDDDTDGDDTDGDDTDGDDTDGDDTDGDDTDGDDTDGDTDDTE